MAETTKKAKAPVKPKKEAAEPKKAAAKTVAAEKQATSGKIELVENSAPKTVSTEEVAKLAHRFWAERGHQHGSHVEDWFRAEHELRGKAS